MGVRVLDLQARLRECRSSNFVDHQWDMCPFDRRFPPLRCMEGEEQETRAASVVTSSVDLDGLAPEVGRIVTPLWSC